MILYPSDFGEFWHIALVRGRAVGTARVQTAPREGFWGRIWAAGVNVPPAVTRATLPLLADSATPLLSVTGTFAVLGGVVGMGLGLLSPEVAIGGMAGTLATTGVLIPRFLFARLHHKPVTYAELEDLKGSTARHLRAPLRDRAAPPRHPIMRLFQSLKGTTPKRPGDDLEQAYLSMAQNILSTENLSETTQTELRGVLRALGNAVATVPRSEAVNSDELQNVRVEAQTLYARARRETDSEVAASLTRQADALDAKAQAGENARKLARRVHALRDELFAHTQTVRTLLPQLQSTSASAATEWNRFATVSATVQSMATEAASLQAAQQEIADYLSPALDFSHTQQNASAGSPMPDAQRFTLPQAQPEAPVIRLHNGRD